MACTAKCDSCKSFRNSTSSILPAAGGDRGRPNVTGNCSLGWCRLPCPLRMPILFVRTTRSWPESFVHCAGANVPMPGNALSLATHHQKQPPPDADVTATDRGAQQRNQERSSGKRHRASRVMVCLTRARLHTTLRDWQRTVGQGGGVSAETPARPRLALVARVAPLLLS
jgi:hypothetical protein